MAAVVFAFGLEPALRERQAREVAMALAARRDFSAQSAATKIRHQARINLDAGEASEEVELDLDELASLSAVMNEVAWPDDEVEYAYLRRQLSLVV